MEIYWIEFFETTCVVFWLYNIQYHQGRIREQELVQLVNIVQRFGAIVVDNGKEVMNDRVTRILPYDLHEYDAKDIDEEEGWKEREEEMESGRWTKQAWQQQNELNNYHAAINLWIIIFIFGEQSKSYW